MEEVHTMKADRFVIRPKLLAALASLALLAAGVAAQASRPSSYPEHGQVIATRLGAEAVGSAGVVGSLKRWVYRVDCGDLYYDLQGGGKPSLTIGQDVAFRIEKQKVYLDDGKNGKRYNIVGTGKADQKQSPKPN
jgi:hypothetical protein